MQDELIRLLAGRRGHFQMESGYHAEQWFDLGKLFAQPEQLRPFIAELADRLGRHAPNAICGPVTGGAQLAAAVARELGVPSFAAERIAPPPNATGLFPVRYELPVNARAKARGLRVAIVDDAVSAGSAIRGTFTHLLTCGAQPIAFGALFVFGDAVPRFAREKNLPLEGVATLAFPMWPPTDCPLCRARVPLEKISDAP